MLDDSGDPVEDCDDPDGGQGAQEEREVDQYVGVPGVLPMTGYVTRDQVVHHKVEWSRLKNVSL